MADKIFLIDTLFFLTVALLVAALIYIKSTQTYRLANRDRSVYMFKACLALAIWVVLSMWLLWLIFVYVYTRPHVKPGEPPDSSWIWMFTCFVAGYALIGYALVRWMKRVE
jgi:hypothetical protein